ncbi:HD domain-containing protein [Ureaplasma urealyticum]|uniref:HD domain-containing protein n=3 Tax=Ureaplasma urealyticum TaxID=2130 RepID=A0AAP9ADA4_UREUR|nr:HD domain-containing protein [Ureaplasma urealyticum]EDX54224.1 HD domain protein [Ureaplasma urealyticum serovar 9 str. ATCC 33175]ACI60237.1 HD domain protein [Ureaplasma urealyticum serovar 10 str. ATCC 33699]EDT49583.1 HD domain protein [Ureaplasma urealyticum serovar 13 str. ATCC 33698]EDU06467.1 HD domain protein [Ureaplasma urealyticum serovar 5 str. ATCC 27817]EDU56734.1 HD domain protein [Ureaplasma urealyticum serovar 7 str. ATCC 27819]
MVKNFFIKDPIHGLISFDEQYEWAYELIKTKEFWRLNNIKQLGSSWSIFPSATHTRFTHCIGVFEVTRKLLDSLKFIDSDTQDLANNKKIVCAAALLHDIGHGPFSHTFEYATNYDHEKIGQMIITDPKSDINKILLKHHINPIDVANVIDHKSKKMWMQQVISSQIDADRLDYLPRDSHFTGTKYGNIDYDNIFKKAIVFKDRLCFSKYSWNALENILISRWSMFENVYLNKTPTTYDILMKKALARVYYLYQKHKNYQFKNPQLLMILKSWLTDENWDIASVQALDDYSFTALMRSLATEDDFILKTLATNWLQNKDFVTFEYEYGKNESKNQKIIHKKYFYETITSNKQFYDFNDPVFLYTEDKSNEIKLLKLEDKSLIIAALKSIKQPRIKKWIFYYKPLK